MTSIDTAIWAEFEILTSPFIGYRENFNHVHTSRHILIYVRSMGESVMQYKKNFKLPCIMPYCTLVVSFISQHRNDQKTGITHTYIYLSSGPYKGMGLNSFLL